MRRRSRGRGSPSPENGTVRALGFAASRRPERGALLAPRTRLSRREAARHTRSGPLPNWGLSGVSCGPRAFGSGSPSRQLYACRSLAMAWDDGHRSSIRVALTTNRYAKTSLRRPTSPTESHRVWDMFVVAVIGTFPIFPASHGALEKIFRE